MADEISTTIPLLPETATLLSPYEINYRPKRNLRWGVAYWSLVGLCVGLGVFATLNISPDYAHLDDDSYLSDPNNCPVQPPFRPDQPLFSANKNDDPDDQAVVELVIRVLTGFCITPAVSVAIGVLMVLAFAKAPKLTFFTLCGLTVLIPTFSVLLPLAAGLTSIAVPSSVLLMVLLAGAIVWRRKFVLCAHLLAVAAKSLRANVTLLGWSLLLQAAALPIFIIIVILLALAATNGSLQRRSDVHYDVIPSGKTVCFYEDSTGNRRATTCCSFTRDAWAKAYIVLLGLLFLWTVMLLGELRRYIVAGYISQWYYATNTSKAARERSRRHALGASFGSLCACALMRFGLTILAWVLNAFMIVLAPLGWLGCSFASTYASLLQLLQCVFQFTTPRMAIRGEGLWAALSATAALLRRNPVEFTGVGTIPALVLASSVVVAGIIWGISAFTLGLTIATSDEAVMLDAYLSCLDALVSAIIISYFAMVLMDCLNTIYVCFVNDRDLRTVSNNAVYAALSALLPPQMQFQPRNATLRPNGADQVQHHVYPQQQSTNYQQQSNPITAHAMQQQGPPLGSASVSQQWLRDSLAAASSASPEPVDSSNGVGNV